MHRSGVIVQYIGLNVIKAHVTAIIQHEKQTDMQNN